MVQNKKLRMFFTLVTLCFTMHGANENNDFQAYSTEMHKYSKNVVEQTVAKDIADHAPKVTYDRLTNHWLDTGITRTKITEEIKQGLKITTTETWITKNPSYLTNMNIAAAATMSIPVILAGSHLFKNSWEDLQDTVKEWSHYFSSPHTYEQFEKEHDLVSDGMTPSERQQRFAEWQTGEEIQQRMNNTMKQVQRFEQKLDLSSENMNDQDRIEIFKTWQKQEREAQRLMKKMQPINVFEKKHGLLSQDMTDKERIKRYQEWQQGDKQQKTMLEKMKLVKPFERKHGLLSENMSEDERLQRYKEWNKGDLQQQDFNAHMKKVAAFEKNQKLSSTNLHAHERIARYQAWEKEEQHKKFMRGFARYEAERNWLKKYYPTEEERIQYYKDRTVPIERYMYENYLN